MAAALPVASPRASDRELAALAAAGNDAAFAVLHARHSARLVAEARKILGSRGALAEDVVQEAFLRAHRALRRGGEIEHVRAWLHRLVRNCALDELGRTRVDALPLHEVHAAGEPAALGADPDVLLSGRERVRATLEDIAALPELQRVALLRREIDGASHERLASELGTSVGSAKSLVFRARENLTKAARARDARCRDVRDELLAAHDRRRRASAHAYRHLAVCGDCRHFRQSLGVVRGALHLLSPTPALLAAAVALKAVLGGSGAAAASSGGAAAGGGSAFGGGAAAGGSLGAKLAGTAAAGLLAAGGAIGIQQVAAAGDPAPVSARSAVLPDGALERGAAVPRGVAVVTREVRLAPGTPPRATLACPPGLRVAGLVPADGAPALAYAPETVAGSSTTARVLFQPATSARTITVASLCKRPDRTGSLLAEPAARAATDRPAARVCARRAYLRARPGGRGVVGSVSRGQPLVLARTSGGWLRVRTDTAREGWLRPTAVC